MISACLIAKDASPSLEAAIASVRGRVDEVVVVFTRRKKPDEVAVRGIDVVDFFDSCNAQADCPPEGACHCRAGDIVDFSTARNKSFELARHPWALWLDSDDVVTEGDLRALCDEDKPVLSPYEYQYDGEGRVNRLLHLPRVVPQAFRWSYPVHETLLDARPRKPRFDDRIVWKHQAKPGPGRNSTARNLRVCLHWQRDPRFNKDPRFIYHFGLSLYQAGDYANAYRVLEKHAPVEPDPALRCASAMLIAKILPPHLGLPWAHKALEAMPLWPAPWFCLARSYERLNQHAAAIQFARAGLYLDVPRTHHAVDPSEHESARVLIATSLAATLNSHSAQLETLAQ
jgi:hypothetical protein